MSSHRPRSFPASTCPSSRSAPWASAAGAMVCHEPTRTRMSRRSTTGASNAISRCSCWAVAATSSISDEGFPGLVMQMAVSRAHDDATDRRHDRDSRRGRVVGSAGRVGGRPGLERRGVPVRYPGNGRRHAHPERRCVRAGSRRASSSAWSPSIARDPQLTELTAADCGFSYRMSRFKPEDAGRFIVCGVAFRLTRSTPALTYPELVAELERRGRTQPRPRTFVTPFSRSGVERAWCSTRAIRTPAAWARFS